MTVIVTTDIVFDGHSAVEIQKAYEFEKANDMSIWKKYDSTYCIVFRKEERTHCDPIHCCPKCGEDLWGKTDG